MKLRKAKNKKLIKSAMKFQSWDFGFNLELEMIMLEYMYQFYSSNQPVVVSAPRIAKEINLAIKLLKIANDEDSSVELLSNGEWISTKYVNIRNANRFMNTTYEFHTITKDALRQVKAWYLYNKLRYYRMWGWWDIACYTFSVYQQGTI